MSRLSEEKSPYLRHTASQKIDWYPWSDKPFEKARELDKPVFLSSGAIWCHWCHVMAKECFENEEIAELLNALFINIKLDRDERPEIDRRYQQAVSLMGFGGGWPLSVFLTPDKKPFFGGTYFPPEDSFGRPGFKKVLRTVADYYKLKRKEITEHSEAVIRSLKPQALPEGTIDEASVNEAVTNILMKFDSRNGGFGSAPKFPTPGALELLINQYYFYRLESIGKIIKKTLSAMAQGGYHDQIGGGFHRYSVDEAWIIPHFEKMADDNAWHLRNYIDAYAVFGIEYFRKVAEGIISFIRDVLSDPDGGFYASQDADVTPDDEGGYFTWMEKDFRAILSDEEYTILSMHFLDDKGAMHHDKSKKVLFISMSPEEIARKTGKDIHTVSDIIRSGKEKLLQERNKRKSPFIDNTLYTSLNGMLISSFLRCYRFLRDEKLKTFALKSLQKIMEINAVEDELYHTEGVKGCLNDYIFIIEAFLSAYEITGNASYLLQAENLMEVCLEKFWDYESGGFFDTESEVLGVRLKSIDDIPHPSANSVGIMLLFKLYDLTEKLKYIHHAETALKIFVQLAKEQNIYSSYFFCALDALFRKLKLNMNTSPEDKLGRTALSTFYPYSSFLYGEESGSVIPCVRDTCYEPIKSREALKNFFSNLQIPK